MYTLASVFFEKDDKYYLKPKIRVVCRECLAFKYVFIVSFFETNQMIENSCLNLVFRYTISICICVDR